MRRGGTVLAAAAAAVGAASLAAAGPAGGAVRADWDLRARGGIVLDASDQGHRLTLKGDWSSAGGPNGDAVRFAKRSLAVTRDADALDPGGKPFAVSIRFRAPAGLAAFAGTDSPNLVQKGRFDSRGQWKLQLRRGDGGQVQCRMKGSGGAVLVTSPVRSVVSDRDWHVATCVRRDRSVELVVDGRSVVRRTRVGIVRSDRALTVANKVLRSSSDQFVGIVDGVAIAKGGGAERQSRRALRP